MPNFKLSNQSLNKLNKINPKLKLLTEEVIKISPFDFTVTEGLRTAKTQQEYYKKGASRCDGIKNKSKHQEGLAIDIMCYDTNSKGAWEKKYYIEVAKVFKEKAKELNINIRWGGDFKGFFDGPHFELI